MSMRHGGWKRKLKKPPIDTTNVTSNGTKRPRINLLAPWVPYVVANRGDMASTASRRCPPGFRRALRDNQPVCRVSHSVRAGAVRTRVLNQLSQELPQMLSNLETYYQRRRNAEYLDTTYRERVANLMKAVAQLPPETRDTLPERLPAASATDIERDLATHFAAEFAKSEARLHRRMFGGSIADTEIPQPRQPERIEQPRPLEQPERIEQPAQQRPEQLAQLVQPERINQPRPLEQPPAQPERRHRGIQSAPQVAAPPAPVTGRPASAPPPAIAGPPSRGLQGAQPPAALPGFGNVDAL